MRESEASHDPSIVSRRPAGRFRRAQGPLNTRYAVSVRIESTPHRASKRLRAILFVAMNLLWPAISLACPTCYGASSEKVISMYLWSAALLTLLPFSMLGIGYAIVVYLRRQAAAVDAREANPLPQIQ